MLPSTSNAYYNFHADGSSDSNADGSSDSNADYIADPNAIDGIEATQLMTQNIVDQKEMFNGHQDVVMDESQNEVETGSIDGIESTQLMSQGSIRKRDKKKIKMLNDADRKALKRRHECKEEKEKRKNADAEHKAQIRSMETEPQKSRRNKTDALRKSARRSQEPPDVKKQRNHSNSERMSARRSVEPDGVRQERNRSNAVRTAATRANESIQKTFARQQADKTRKMNRPSALLGIAATEDQPDQHYSGNMDNECRFCGALYFKCETTTKGEFNACCLKGAVNPELKLEFPSELKKLFLAHKNIRNQALWREAKNFQENLRQYNNSLAMASMVAQIKTPEGGPYCFRIHKQVYHKIGDLHPLDGEKPNFAQIFIIDTEQAAAELSGREMNKFCTKGLFEKLIDILKAHNPYTQSYKMMYEVEQEEHQKALLENREERRVSMTFHVRSDRDKRRYQESTANEVAVVYVGDDEEIPGERRTTVYQKTGTTRFVHAIDKNCEPLSYPLLFPTGQFGWHIGIPYTHPRGKKIRVSMREFYAFNLHTRNRFSPLFRAGKLFQQYVVDAWTRVEQSRLDYIKNNQNLLRSEPFNGLQDYVNGEETGPVGRRVYMLPASHTGSPRDMVQQYQDAMTVVSRYGKPDYFLTMTCNPKWREIEECLHPGQTASDRPDVVARVFQMKLTELRNDLFKKNVLGEVLAYIYVVEFQKRGLPHVHMLIIMKPGSKPRTSADVDKIISAELPDKDKNPELYRLVTTLMMHRACGVDNPKSPCMEKGECNKGFPKAFRDTTSTDHDGFSLYRRRDDGRFYEQRLDGRVIELTNQHVVPYNAWLLLKFQCHINLEVCGAMSSVKYLYKYVYKGTTRASILISVDKDGNEQRVLDEFKNYLDTRFVCAPEAMHRLFQFAMSYRSVTVYQLTVHLPGEENVTFEAGEEEEALEKAAGKLTKLEAWFKKNRECKEAELPDGTFPITLRDSRQYFYHQMPEYFTFSSGAWNQRKTFEIAVGRMFFISPKNRERFALRQLLLYTKGATSYEDLRTVQGKQYTTFVEAARAAGYLADDLVHEQTLREAADFNTPRQLRGLFVTLLCFEEVNNAEDLWTKFLKDFVEDFKHQGFGDKEAESLAYFDLVDRMEAMNEDLTKWLKLSYLRVQRDKNQIDYDQCKKDGEEMLEMLNPEQRAAIEAIIKALESGMGGLFFIDGPGGSGKTFMYNCLANLILGRRLKILPIAWTGIAASLLPDGRTVASVCKLDILNGCRASFLRAGTILAKRLAEVVMVLWDEAPMSPKAALETVDLLFRDITGCQLPFGGKVVVLGGDFRQVLPVVEKGRVDDQISNCIKKSHLWKDFQTFHLKTNMRLTGDARDWKNELLRIGDGKVGAPVTGEMPIPQGLKSSGDLVEDIFGDLLDTNKDKANSKEEGAKDIDDMDVDTTSEDAEKDTAEMDVKKIAKVAILTPRNKEALEMNNSVLDKMKGELKIYNSLDEAVPKHDQVANDSMNYPTEFLNRMTPSGMPPHELRLKKGAIVMLLRNLDVKNSMCNGTRFIVDSMGHRVLKCKFVSGPRQGEFVLIPKIKLNYDQNLPFTLSRYQFPIRLSFAMTVNKSQGQTFDKIGLKLDEPIFSHGQLYVALSRTTSKDGIRIDSSSGLMNNVVYQEVLR